MVREVDADVDRMIVSTSSAWYGIARGSFFLCD